MMTKNNFQKFEQMLNEYLHHYDITTEFMSNLHDASENNSDPNKPIAYVYNGAELEVINMDTVAKNGYKAVKNSENTVNSCDAFVINSNNEWYFIEFKDGNINVPKVKSDIIKKAYANWYMVLDILFEMKDAGTLYSDFDTANPVKFAREHVNYLLVCSSLNNPNVYIQVKNHNMIQSSYTPDFMMRIKDYLFKEACIYTEDYFERTFVNCFTY